MIVTTLVAVAAAMPPAGSTVHLDAGHNGANASSQRDRYAIALARAIVRFRRSGS